MNYFLDTNVIIGYIFDLDYLNKNVKSFLNNNFHYFYSTTVKNEVNNVFKIKIRQYQSFLLELSDELDSISDNELINEFKLYRLIFSLKSGNVLDVNKLHYILNLIWNQLNLDENHDSFDLKHKFNCYKNNFYANHFTCNENFFSKMICVPSHTKKDTVILNKIFEKHLRNILHENDENILFDAMNLLRIILI